MDPHEALRHAIDLLKVPSRVRHARSSSLARGTQLVLAIAAGERELEREVTLATGHPPDLIQRAAAFYIEQILLAPEADSYRILGSSPEASNSELRRNMALLLRWLHPDLAGGSERAVFATRVAAAWDDVKTRDRRQAYDKMLLSARLERQSRAKAMTRRARWRRIASSRPLLLAPAHATRRPAWHPFLFRLLGRRS